MRALWQLVKLIYLLSAFPWLAGFKSSLLRLFGAKVGCQVYWKPQVNIHLPWKPSVSDQTWVGEEVCIINFAPVTIGSHSCLSQLSMICSGNHDYRATDMRYRHAPITLSDGVGIGACVFVGPGVEVGTDAVLSAGAVATKSLEAGGGHVGKPCQSTRRRCLAER